MKLFKNVLCILCFPLLLMNTQCDDDDNMSTAECGQPVIIDNAFYEKAVTDTFSLVDFDIVDDCLTVEVGASGCDSESWSLVLVDSGAIAESFPEQRNLKLIFTNDEACLAVFSQTRIFNLIELRVQGSNEVVLNIEGIPEAINYMYP